MSRRAVPVTYGSVTAASVCVPACQVTHARFPPNAILESHVHERPTVAVMLSGSFDLVFSRVTFACPPASVSIEPAGERHSNRIDRGGAEVVVIQPDTHADEVWLPFAPVLDSTAQFLHGGVRLLAANLAGEVARADAFSALAVQALTLEVLVAAARAGPERYDSRQLPRWLLLAQEIIHDEMLDRIDLETLATATGVHPSRLARSFRRHFGVSIGAYARRVRLDRVATRLSSHDEPIAAIAADEGFADQSHLTRAFKQHYGVTPRYFRDRCRRGDR